MADRTQELTLLLKAKIAGQGALDTMSLGLDKVADKARGVGDELGRMGGSLGAGLGNLTENLLTGQDFATAATNLGAFMAGEMVQEFSGDLAAKLGSSTLVAGLAAPLAGIGTAIGGLISAAIPIGMALLPFIIIGAIVAAIAVLIFNEDIRNKVFAFVGELISNIGKFLGNIGATLLAAIGAGVDWVAKNIGPFVGGLVGAIIDGLVSLPGKIADVIASAFRNLKIDIGPFHISGTKGITIDLPTIEGPGPGGTGKTGFYPKHSQGGGWVGLEGPEIRMVGEAGPEYVIPNHALGAGSPTTVVIQIAGQTVAQVLLPLLSGELAAGLQSSAPTALRT
jgi:hypothetical protein